MSKRINVILPDRTIQVLDRLAKAGERSRFIDKAVLHYAATHSVEALREQLRLLAIRDRDLEMEIGEEWSVVDHETWQQLDTAEKRSRGTGRSGAKSTSQRSIRR